MKRDSECFGQRIAVGGLGGNNGGNNCGNNGGNYGNPTEDTRDTGLHFQLDLIAAPPPNQDRTEYYFSST